MKNYKNQILEELENAQESIKVAVCWVTDPDLIDKLIEKAKNRVKVEVIMSADEWNILRYYEFKRLRHHGGIVRKYGPENNNEENFMHCKFAIIDGQTVMEGSYNWSKNAQTNMEQMRVDKSRDRYTILHADFNEMMVDSFCFFEGVSNPEEVINKYQRLENKAIQPDTNERARYDMKLETSKNINAGTAHTSAIGTITSANSTASRSTNTKPNKPHRFYGGRRVEYFQNSQVLHPFTKAAYQKYHLDKDYDFLESTIVNGHLISTGMVQPNGCDRYQIRIDWTAGKTPKVTILNKEIEPSDEIHMYKDQSLCLFYPLDLKWQNHLKISDYIIPWTIEWIVFYELYQVTGKWFGKEAAHGIRE